MLQKLCGAAAWGCLIFIIFATLSSAGARPKLTTTETALVVFVERFGAYCLLGLLFYLTYPRRLVLVCLVVFGSAVVLELLQMTLPDRDARVIDVAEKLAGGAAGLLAAKAFLSFAARKN
jgi:VanZ family protein